MSSKLQLDVCHFNQWWHHLVNAYEVEAGIVLFAGKTVLSMPEHLRGFTTRRQIHITFTFTFTFTFFFHFPTFHKRETARTVLQLT